MRWMAHLLRGELLDQGTGLTPDQPTGEPVQLMAGCFTVTDPIPGSSSGITFRPPPSNMTPLHCFTSLSLLRVLRDVSASVPFTLFVSQQL